MLSRKLCILGLALSALLPQLVLASGPAPRGPGADSIEALACQNGGGQFDSGWHNGKIEYRCQYPDGKVIRGTVEKARAAPPGSSVTPQPKAIQTPQAIQPPPLKPPVTSPTLKQKS